MQQAAAHNQPEYTVSEISVAIKHVVESSFEFVRVRGEISGSKLHSSGHFYFSLKDAGAVLNAVCWKGKFNSLKFKPEEGLEVIALGKISTFGGQSKYQLIVDSLEPAGAGALMALLEKRKKEYEAKGYFAPARKKPLPYMPQRIGVVTSPTGAVIRDILHRITERFPTNVVVWPVKVQGQGAELEIAEAIAGFNKMANPPQVIIVARGGGSLEDLWCFNEPPVIEAVFASAIPIISAVGHETDTTLIDYVSDKRAPTPTAAAELATPVIADVRYQISDFRNRADKAINRVVVEREKYLSGLLRGLPKLADVFGAYEQKLDSWTERLKMSLPNIVIKYEKRLAGLVLRPVVLLADVGKLAEKLNGWNERLQKSASSFVEKREEKVLSLGKLFDSYNYKNVLKRGFALVKNSDGKLVKSATAAKGDLQIEFADGVVKASS
jgi:exodeoxyribonuclease VII large subunit